MRLHAITPAIAALLIVSSCRTQHDNRPNAAATAGPTATPNAEATPERLFPEEDACPAEISALRARNPLEKPIAETVRAQTTKMDGHHYDDYEDVVRGDMDGDRDSDAALLYSVEGFGIGFDGELVGHNREDGRCSNIHDQILAVLLNEGSSWSVGAQEEVGGRAGKNVRGVTLVRIAAGIIYLDTLDYAKSDAMCCPSVPGKTRYRLEGRSLVEMNGA